MHGKIMSHQSPDLGPFDHCCVYYIPELCMEYMNNINIEMSIRNYCIKKKGTKSDSAKENQLKRNSKLRQKSDPNQKLN
jgi:hypothetical protein